MICRLSRQAAKFFNGNNSVTSVRFLLKRAFTEGEDTAKAAHLDTRTRGACVFGARAFQGVAHARAPVQRVQVNCSLRVATAFVRFACLAFSCVQIRKNNRVNA